MHRFRIHICRSIRFDLGLCCLGLSPGSLQHEHARPRHKYDERNELVCELLVRTIHTYGHGEDFLETLSYLHVVVLSDGNRGVLLLSRKYPWS